MVLDFYTIQKRKKGRGADQYYEIYPIFKITRSKDLMVRGGAFYAVWNPETQLWSTDAYDVINIIDKELYSYADELREKTETQVYVQSMENDNTGNWTRFYTLLKRLPDNYQQLDGRVTFINTPTTKESYISKRLPYPLEEGECPNFYKLFSTLYDEENLKKLMWAIGSVIAGDSKRIQKFYVLFGPPGTGKSTALNLISRMFGFHVDSFEASDLGSPNNTFALSSFADNPLVAIDHEGDLSLIRKNSALASIVSHDDVVVNVKYQQPFSIRLNTCLFIATNKPVKITDRKSGIIRRLVDINPTGVTINEDEYTRIQQQLEFELGAIAFECLKTYRELGMNYYSDYAPEDMMFMTNVVFNFIDEHFLEFSEEQYTTLSKAWTLYKQYCEDMGITERLPRHILRNELSNYWEDFHRIHRIDGKQVRSVFENFKTDMFGKKKVSLLPPILDWLSLSPQESIFDMDHAEQPAQYATESGTPRYKWDHVKTNLRGLDPHKLHYVIPKPNHIVIDLDIKDQVGDKSLDLNIEAAKQFPPTYVETSMSGQGLHLHYYYTGDIDKLSRIYDIDIEVKLPIGRSSIRRKLSVCNDHAITTINSGLPLKPDKGEVMVNKKIANEKSLRLLVLRNLAKDIHPATKPSVDFIHLLLNEAYNQGLTYDISDLEPKIIEFAGNSTNNAEYCLNLVETMPFKSDDVEEETSEDNDGRIVFFDVEVFPNLLLICWKLEGDDVVQRMINPTPIEVSGLLNFRLIGFNNRRYDNHILWAALQGYTNKEIYDVSSNIISGAGTAYFDKAWGLSYADVYWFLSLRKSLKHLQVEYGLDYDELDIPWDEPAPEELWPRIGEYCANDVIATEYVFHKHASDFHARQILAELSGMRVNDSTRNHVAKILFGNVREPQSDFIYTDLREEFHGYEYKKGVSTYKGEKVGEGGYVYAEPGMYNNVVYMDIASMHPASLVELNLFGPYTKRFEDLMKARILIKQGKLDRAAEMFNGRLAKYLTNEEDISGLAYALKIALNSVYGYTTSRFDNPFRDIRNKDNIVAKRGALFMVDLKEELQKRGSKPIHFKTDSVKIADHTQEDIDFVVEFGKKYGYDFGVEGVYERMVLINDAVLVGKWEDSEVWDAVGARFAHPYIYKKLFSKEPIEFEDLIETRAVRKGTIYMEKDGNMVFIGRIGEFCPMKENGGILYRVHEGKNYAVTGTKGYLWYPAKVVKDLGLEDDIDLSYFNVLLEEAYQRISEYGDPTIFLGEN